MTSFFTAPYAVSPPHASGASWSPMLSGIATSAGAHTVKYSANVPMIGLRLRAVPGLAREAVLARAAPVAAAGTAEAEDHPVADRRRTLGARPERLDDPDGLVPDRPGARHAVPVAACEVEVGVAHARRGDL